MVTIDIKIDNPQIEEKYTIKEIKDFLYFHLENLKNVAEEDVDYRLYKIDYKDLTEEQQEKVDKIRKMTNEELEKNFISI